MIRYQNKNLVVSFPSPILDVLQWIFFPLNYVLGLLCYIQPGRPKWNEADFEKQDLSGTGIDTEELKRVILERKNTVYNEADIVRLFDTLPIVSSEKDLIGNAYVGKVLRTNRSALDFAEWAINWPLLLLGFKWGKRYCSMTKGDPLFLRWLGFLYIPLPIWGNVGMQDIRWRGEPTATMHYDHQPWKDYFRLLTNNNGETVLLGVWTHKNISGGWFTLTLDKNITANGK